MIQNIPARKHIAVVAHDNKKGDLLDWVGVHRDSLVVHNLYATGTTGTLLEENLGLSVTKLQSGPLGGDQQIGRRSRKERSTSSSFSGTRWSPSRTIPT